MNLINMPAVAALLLTAPTFANNSIIPVAKETKEMAAALRNKAVKDGSAVG